MALGLFRGIIGGYLHTSYRFPGDDAEASIDRQNRHHQVLIDCTAIDHERVDRREIWDAERMHIDAGADCGVGRCVNFKSISQKDQ